MSTQLKNNFKYLISFAFLTICQVALAAPQVSIDTQVEKEIRETDENGQVTTRKVPAEQVTPGDVLFFTLTYSNQGDEAATNVKLDNPIPNDVVYEADSAWGESGVDILFTVDGQTFKQPANLSYEVSGESRIAAPEQYSAIRWMVGEIAPGSSGSVGFSARVK